MEGFPNYPTCAVCHATDGLVSYNGTYLCKRCYKVNEGVIVKDWERLQNHVASKLGGAVRPNSGATWHAKGDVITPSILAECKYTDKKSYSVTREVLDKAVEEAKHEGRMPMLVVGFPHAKLPGQIEAWAMIPLDDMEAIIDNQKEE